ncbi:MAG: Holliday junction branch migration protein RuvA [Pseudomonadota bacterium]
MIGKLSGRVDARMADHVLLDVGGVGYIVFCSERTLGALPEGEFATLYTDLLVREDLMQLFGFLTPLEKEWHRLLTTVQGVGAKAALAIQGTLGTDAVARAIALGDAAAIKAAPGVGPKLAARVVAELKDKTPAMMGIGAKAAPTSTVQVVEPSSGNEADALSALVNLGYTPADAAEAVARSATDGISTGDLIKAALKLLGPNA